MKLLKLIKNYKSLILILIIILFFLEIFSYLFLALYFKGNQACNYDALYQKRVRLFKDKKFREVKTYDKLLGWDYKSTMTLDGKSLTGKKWIAHIDNKGRRLNPYISSKNVISTYGDSFTLCQEVNDNQTWQYFLSKLTDTNVINYGVAAYGIDQAVLKLERNLKNNTDRPRIVILGLYEQDINRSLTMDYAFFNNKNFHEFKPIFHKENDKYILIDNPLDSLDSLESFKKAYKICQKYDYWYKYCNKYQARFPFTLSLIKIYKAALNNDFNKDFRSNNLYKNKEATDKMTYTIERFVDLSDKYHFKPVLLVIPPQKLFAFKSYQSKDFINHLKQDTRFSKLKIINIIDYEFELEKFNILPHKGHASEYGNRVIADVLYQNLKDEIKKISISNERK